MLAFFTAGGYEWIIVLIIALLLFGKRLPKVMKSLGEGVRMFKKGARGIGDESLEGDDDYDEDADGPYEDVDADEDAESKDE